MCVCVCVCVHMCARVCTLYIYIRTTQRKNRRKLKPSESYVVRTSEWCSTFRRILLPPPSGTSSTISLAKLFLYHIN